MSYQNQRRDTATLLLTTLSGWYQKEPPNKIRKKFSTLRRHKQEDERSLCQSDWSADASMDQAGYGSIFLQIQEASSDSDGSCQFVARAMEILQNTILVTGILGLFIALPVAMVSLGVKYLQECPKEPKVPIYLLVGGCFGLLKVLSLLWRQVRSRRYEKLDEISAVDEEGGDGVSSKSSRFTEAILSLFLFIWFIFGNYWVFHIWKPNFKQLLHEPNNWCEETVYMFAVAQIFTCYGVMGLIILLTVILAMCHHCMSCCDKS